jgi:hypothetical protein
MTVGRLLRSGLRFVTGLLTVAAFVAITSGVWAAPFSQIESLVVEIQAQVAQIRGLDVRSETPVVLIPRSELVARLSRELNTERTVREFLTSQTLLEVLGVMQPGFDLRDLQVRLLDEQTLAVYDYQDRTVYVMAEALEAGDLDVNSRLVLAHELTHALQDQHFGLRRVLPTDPENSDVAMAGRALVEGDAMLTMRIWGRQFLRPNDKRDLGDDTIPSDPVLDSAPLLVQGETLFPYDAGWVFAQLLFQDGGIEAVNQAFARPPRSTEQILHPEKYQAGEHPVSVTIAPLEVALGGTWKTLRTDVFGELVLRLLLEPHVGWPTAEGAAAGWGGDAYTILEDGTGRRVVALMTVWDTEADAAEMFNAFSESIPAQFLTNQRRTLARAGLGRWTIPEYQVQVLKTDNTVRIVYAPDGATLEQVDALISAAVVGPSGPVAPPPPTPPAPVVTVAPESSRPTSTPRPADDEISPDLTDPAVTMTPGASTTATPTTGLPTDDELPSDDESPADDAPPAFVPLPPIDATATPVPASSGPTSPGVPSMPANQLENEDGGETGTEGSGGSDEDE